MPRRIATLISDPDLEAKVATRLGAHPDIEIVMRCVDRVELLALVRSRSIDGVVSVGHPHWLDAETVNDLSLGGVPVIGVSDHPLDAEGLARLRIATLHPTEPAEVMVDRLFSRGALPEPALTSEGVSGELVAVWGPKGCPGRTTVAIELAASVASSQPRTLLFDADAYGGDIVQRLGIIEDVPTVIWAARMSGKGEWDESLVVRDLRRAGAHGPVVLPGIPRAELWAEISEYGLDRLLEDVRRHFVLTVADVGFCLEPSTAAHLDDAGRNRMARSIVSAADRVVAILGPGPLALRAFVAAWPDLISLVEPERVTIVANRVSLGMHKEISDAVRAAVGRPVAVTLPDVWGDAQHALKRSRSILEARPRCSLGEGIRDLAASLGAKVERKGLLIRLGGKA